MLPRSLPLATLRARPGRSALLVALVALLSFALAAGWLVLESLARGLGSLEARLGADLVVMPRTARSTDDLEAILVDGVPGHFYMDASLVDEVAAREGVERVSPQYLLASVKAGCCSMPVQIVGFDPQSDFVIQPWVARSYAGELGPLDVVAGSDISGAPGATITFYGVDCRIVAKLDETGTAMDSAVFATSDTLRTLIEGSRKQGLAALADADPGSVVSTVQVRLADGARASDVADDINLHLRGAYAVTARAMTSDVADSVAGVASVVRALVAGVLALAVLSLVAAFAVVGRQRAREFAVLRVAGASRRACAALVLAESAVLGAAGSLLGAGIAAVAATLFATAVEHALGLPFLVPSVPELACRAALSALVALACACASSALAAWNASRLDVGRALRGE